MNRRLACSTSILAGLLAVTAGCRIPTTPAETTPSATPELAALEIAPEADVDYERENWPHWSYVADGCDVRDRVLIEQGREVVVGDDCEIVSGTWISVYDGQVVHDSSELDIDHRVALSEAADSGAGDWTEDQRETYANDPRVLIAVTAHSNRSKGARDPSEWLPEQHVCRYVREYIEVKAIYGLTVDEAEHDALERVLAGC